MELLNRLDYQNYAQLYTYNTSLCILDLLELYEAMLRHWYNTLSQSPTVLYLQTYLITIYELFECHKIFSLYFGGYHFN